MCPLGYLRHLSGQMGRDNAAVGAMAAESSALVGCLLVSQPSSGIEL